MKSFKHSFNKLGIKLFTFKEISYVKPIGCITKYNLPVTNKSNRI